MQEIKPRPAPCFEKPKIDENDCLPQKYTLGALMRMRLQRPPKEVKEIKLELPMTKKRKKKLDEINEKKNNNNNKNCNQKSKSSKFKSSKNDSKNSNKSKTFKDPDIHGYPNNTKLTLG